jgi:hypothetical protein
LAVLLLAALALLAAGCGGDDSDSSASSDTTTTAVVETDTSDDGTMTAGTETSADDDTAALGGECAKFSGLAAKLQNAFGTGAGDVDSAAEVFDEIADQVPEEIRDDYQVLADNFKELADALKGVDLSSGEAPSPETLQKLQELSSKMDTPAVTQASQNIEAWVKENC